MFLWKAAMATAAWGLPVKLAIQVAGDAGAEGLQFDCRNELKPGDLSSTARAELRYLLSERGLGVSSLTVPLRRPLADEQFLEARLVALRDAMQLAADLKCRTLTVAIGPLPSLAKSAGDEKLWGGKAPTTPEISADAVRLRELLNDLARQGNHLGVLLTISAAVESPAHAVEWLNLITQGPLAWDFDPAAWVMSRLDPVAALKVLHAHVGHFQIRDAVSSLDRYGPGEEAPVGRGDVSWEPLLAIIDDMKYRGWLTVRRTTGSDSQQDSRNALAYIRRVSQGE